MPSLYGYNDPIERVPAPFAGYMVDTMALLPSASSQAGFFAQRASNTILKGGRKVNWRGIPFEAGDYAKRTHQSFFNPYSWGRYPHVEMYSANYYAWGKPSNFVGGATARGAEAAVKGPITPFGTAQFINAAHRTFTGVETPLITPGYSGILTSTGSMGKGFGTKSATVALREGEASNIMEFLRQGRARPYIADILTESSTTVDRKLLTQAMLASGEGSVTGTMGGFISGSMAGGGEMNPTVAKFATEHFTKGFNVAAKWSDDVAGGVKTAYGRAVGELGAEGVGNLAKGKILGSVLGKSAALKLGSMAPAASAVAGPIGMVMFAYDMAKLVTGIYMNTVVKPALNLTRDAMHSYMGTAAKPVMGMGFRDTEATATMRQRGVMAIQNSRLNARSMLGNEAGMAYSHFG